MGFTANQWAILALVLVLGWLLGLLSRSGGARWRRLAAEEQSRREALEARLATANTRIAELERQTAAYPIGAGTAASVGAAAAGTRDDLALIRGVGREREVRLNDAGIHNYRQLAALTDGEANDLEARLALPAGVIDREQWREQAAMLRDRRIEDHRAAYP